MRQLKDSDGETERLVREEIWFKELRAEQEQEQKKMLLLDALQVRMEKNAESGELSDTVTDFKWDVIDFNRDFIWLQISF